MGNLPSHKLDPAQPSDATNLWWPEIHVPSEIRVKLEELCVLQKRIKDLRRDVLKYCRQNGGFVHAGLYVFNLQTVTYEVPLPNLVAEAALELGEPLDLLTAAYFKIRLRGWPGFVRSMPVNKELMALLSRETDGGMTTVYGKPRVDIRGSAPEEGKHIILAPKEKGETAGWVGQAPEDDDSDA